MKKLFPPVLLPNLVNLEEIEVEDCEKMEEIIGGTRSDEEGVMGEESNEFKLPKLRSLRLRGLPELKSICSAKLICDPLQKIYVCKCNSIEIMFPSSWSCLLNLEKITVRECQKMEEIIGGTRSDEEGVMGEENNEFKLPKLRKLILSNLPELKSISSAKLICNSLEKISVIVCEKMEEIIGGTRSDEEGVMGEENNEFKLPKLRELILSNLPELKSISAKLICNSLEMISVKDCVKMEEIIGGTRSDERVMGKESISSEFKLPKLRALRLIDLPELESICSSKLICDSLEEIDIQLCEKLKRIPICLPLLENGQPSPPASLRRIRINPREWWESTVEWEHPNAKDVLRPYVLRPYITKFKPSTDEDYMLQRPPLASRIYMRCRRLLDPRRNQTLSMLKKKKK